MSTEVRLLVVWVDRGYQRSKLSKIGGTSTDVFCCHVFTYEKVTCVDVTQRCRRGSPHFWNETDSPCQVFHKRCLDKRFADYRVGCCKKKNWSESWFYEQVRDLNITKLEHKLTVMFTCNHVLFLMYIEYQFTFWRKARGKEVGKLRVPTITIKSASLLITVHFDWA